MPLASEGYVYVPDEGAGAMANASPGQTIRLPERRAPWIVVNHSINSIVVARWPGRLWRVAVTDAAGIEQVSAHARYTRAFEVKILEELPVSRLFGERGEAVCSVIARSDRLELPQVHLLAGARHPDASKAYSRAWDKWLAEVGGTGAYEGEDLQGALAISAGGSQSPINHGLIVLHHTVFNRAKKLVGSSAFIVDDDGTHHLEPTWAAASHALLESAMAFGAPSVSDADRRIMTAAWYSVFSDNS